MTCRLYAGDRCLKLAVFRGVPSGSIRVRLSSRYQLVRAGSCLTSDVPGSERLDFGPTERSTDA